MEKDDEVKSIEGGSYTTEYRQLDPRIGRWTSLDPLMSNFPWQSPYATFDNNPIYYNDPLGLASEGPGDEEGAKENDETSKSGTGGTNQPKPKTLSNEQFNSLLELGGDPGDKFKAIASIQKGSFTMNSKQLEKALNSPTAPDFLKNNKEELLKVDGISIDNGILTIDLKKGYESINLEGEKDLIVKDGAKIDFSKMKVTRNKVSGPMIQGGKIYDNNVYDATGSIFYTGIVVDGGTFMPNATLISLTYSISKDSYGSSKGKGIKIKTHPVSILYKKNGEAKATINFPETQRIPYDK
jgi:RHS repeat-associated protein